MRRVELTPPVSRYEQLADRIRREIFSGTRPPGSEISGPKLSGELDVSQPVAQRAFEVLVREGLVRTAPGRKTVVLERRRFRAEVTIGPAPGAAFRAARAGCARAMAAHPAVAEGALHLAEAGGLILAMVIEAAELPGAATVALGVARQGAGPAPVTALSVRTETEPEPEGPATPR